MNSLADVFRALNSLREEGVVAAYAVGGGMAALFYAETTRTYDVDVFALIPQAGLLVSLGGIYEWAHERGYETHLEHVVIHGVPVQFLAAREGLETEAVENAENRDYEGVPVPVIRPEYLVVIYVLAGGGKRRERARALFEAGVVDEEKLNAVLERYGLREEWRRKGGGDVAENQD